MDQFTNFARSTLAAGIDDNDLSLSVQAGHGNLWFPDAPFKLVVWNQTDFPVPSDAMKVGEAEIVLVTVRTGDVCTIERAQEGTTAVAHNTAGKVYGVNSVPMAEFFRAPTFEQVTIEGQLSPELLTNPGFTGNANGWTLGAGWSYGSNAVSCAPGTITSLQQSITPIIGKTYRVAVTLSAGTPGTTGALGNHHAVKISLGGSERLYILEGPSTIVFYARPLTAAGLIFTPSDDFDGTIDTVSVKEWPDALKLGNGYVAIFEDSNQIAIQELKVHGAIESAVATAKILSPRYQHGRLYLRGSLSERSFTVVSNLAGSVTVSLEVYGFATFDDTIQVDPSGIKDFVSGVDFALGTDDSPTQLAVTAANLKSAIDAFIPTISELDQLISTTPLDGAKFALVGTEHADTVNLYSDNAPAIVAVTNIVNDSFVEVVSPFRAFYPLFNIVLVDNGDPGSPLTIRNLGNTANAPLRASNTILTAVPVFANNAAAISGGLTAGMTYRTGGDPDLSCIVH